MVAAAKRKMKKAKATEVKPETTDVKPGKVISSQIKKQIAKKKGQKYITDRGVVLIKNLPHGFYEEQLKKYFGQFGKVTRVRVVRSRKTTRSRGFAYVEFAYPEVAEIAAETMNNYLMFRKMIKTVYIPPKDQKFNYFRSGMLMLENKDGKEVLTTRYRLKVEHIMNKYNQHLDADALKKRKSADLKKIQKLKKKMAKYDIDYDIDTVVPAGLKTEQETDVKDESEPEIEAPETLAFDDGDSADDSEAHDLDSDASVEVDSVKAKKKKSESILFAKKASKKLVEVPAPKVEKKKKLAGVEKVKKDKPVKKVKLARAAKEIVKEKKIVENPLTKATKKRTGKKLK